MIKIKLIKSKLLAMVLIMIVPFSNSYSEIHSLTSASNQIGETSSMKGVKYNEYSGAIKIIGESLKFKELRLPITFSQSDEQKYTRLGMNNDIPVSYGNEHFVLSETFAAGWDIGFGYLQVKRPKTEQTITDCTELATLDPSLECSAARGLIEYISPEGGRSEFVRDYLFTDYESETEQIIGDVRFIDKNLRRILTSKSSSTHFTSNSYLMLLPDGKKIVFEPVFQLAENDPELSVMRFYPTQIISPIGEEFKIKYLNGLRKELPANFDSSTLAENLNTNQLLQLDFFNSRISEVSDNTGRKILINYSEYPVTDSPLKNLRPKEIFLDNSPTPVRTFEYGVIKVGTMDINHVVLKSITYKDGNVKSFDFENDPGSIYSSGNKARPYLNRSYNSDGSYVEIEYSPLSDKYCEIQRTGFSTGLVKSILTTKIDSIKAYDANSVLDKGYEFSYIENTGLNLNDHFIITKSSLDDTELVTTSYLSEPVGETFDCMSGQGNSAICCDVKVGNQSGNSVFQYLTTARKQVNGSKISRVTKYINNENQSSSMTEKWYYINDMRYVGNDQITPIFSNNSLPVNRIIQDNGILAPGPFLKQYSFKYDNAYKYDNSEIWHNKKYTYFFDEDQSVLHGSSELSIRDMLKVSDETSWVEKKQAGVDPSFQPSTQNLITKFHFDNTVKHEPDDFVIDEFKYWFNDYNQKEVLYNFINMNLSPVSALISKTERNYHPDFPRTTEFINYSLENEQTSLHTEYYDSSTGHQKNDEHFGFPIYTYRTNDLFKDYYKDYKYGLPKTTINNQNATDGSENLVLSDFNHEGQLSVHASNGEVKKYDYGLDGRVTQIDSGTAVISYQYNEPNSEDLWVKTSKDGVLIEQVDFDHFKRVVKKSTMFHDNSVHLTINEYDSAGRLIGLTNPLGGFHKNVYDVTGRLIKKEHYDKNCNLHSDCNLMKSELINYDYTQEFPYYETTETITYENGSEFKVIRIEENDLIGRPIKTQSMKESVSSNQRSEITGTEFSYDYRNSSEDGSNSKLHVSKQKSILNPLMVREFGYDLINQTRWEKHPEINQNDVVSYKYNNKGMLVQKDTPAKSFTFEYDAAHRLVGVKDELDEENNLIDFIYDEFNNVVEQSINLYGKKVKTIFENFDENNRPGKVITEIPDVLPPATDLFPDKYWLLAPTLNLNWDPNPADSYTVLLKRSDANMALRFESLLQDDIRITPEKIISSIRDIKRDHRFEATKYEQALGEGYLLKPEFSYSWRVLSNSNNGEPIFPSEWIPLTNPINPSDCHIGFFNVENGLNEGALVEWEARNCDKNLHVLQVFASTANDSEISGECQFDNAEYSAHMVGRERALFMLNGYDMVDGMPVFAANPASPQCSGVNSAEFWAVLKDKTSGEIIHEWSRREGRVISGQVCSLRNVNVIHGLSGRAPIISWYAENCDNNTLQVLVDSQYNSERPECLLEKWHWIEAEQLGMDGQIRAHFMSEGYQNNDGIACPPIEKTSLLVRILDDSQNVVERYPFEVFAYPDDSQCRTRIFNGGSAPGIAPLVEWETINCDDYDVRVTRTSVGGVEDSQCFLHKNIWSTVKTGPKFATFMTEGFDRIGTFCEPQYEIDFTIEVLDPNTGLRINENDSYHTLRVQTKGLEYSDSQECHILNYGVFDGYANSSPMVSWSTTPGCAGGKVNLKINSLHPNPSEGLDPVCELNDVTWLSQHYGPAALEFATVGYDQNFIDDGTPGYRCPKDNNNQTTTINEYEVWVEVVNSFGHVVTQTDKKPVYYEPHINQNNTGVCSITPNSFEIISQGGGNNAPAINWQTDCNVGGRYSVNVLASSLSDDDPNPQPSRNMFEIAGAPFNITLPDLCGFQNVTFAADVMGPRPAYFLRNGYHSYRHDHENICNTHSAKFQVVITDTVTGNVIDMTEPLLVSYQGEYSKDPLVDNCFQDSCHELDDDANTSLSQPDSGSTAGVIDNPIATVQGVDLVVSHLSISNINPFVGDEVTVNWKIFNNGTQTATSTDVYFQLKGYSSALHDMTGVIAPQQEVSMSKTFIVPDDWRGSETVYVKVNHSQSLSESNYANNLAFLYLNISEMLPDIEVGLFEITGVDSISFTKAMKCWDRENPILLNAGGTLRMYGTIINEGIISVQEQQHADKFFGYDLTSNQPLTNVQFLNLPAIDVGEIVSTPLEFTLPNSLSSGNLIRLVYLADYANQIAEIDELNNGAVCYLKIQ